MPERKATTEYSEAEWDAALTREFKRLEAEVSLEKFISIIEWQLAEFGKQLFGMQFFDDIRLEAKVSLEEFIDDSEWQLAEFGRQLVNDLRKAVLEKDFVDELVNFK